MKPLDQDRTSTPRVVVLGGGFGGLRAARALAREQVEIVLVDRQNHHLFQPLLYQVATAGLTGPDIAAPIRQLLRKQRNVDVLYADVIGIDTERRQVRLTDQTLDYDHLVVATGATHSYFGNDDWARHAPGLKTLEDANRIRARVLSAFEHAERATSDEERAPWLRMIVVGAGPTGVELAGAMAELARKILPRDFRRFDPAATEILLLEGGDRVLAAYPPDLSASAQKQLEELGVRVRTNTQATHIDEHGVTVAGGERIISRTVLWAAGIQASPLLADLGVERDRAGRAVVAPDLSVPERPEIFVIGDAAHVESDGAEVPGVAPAAMQMGAHAAEQIKRRMAGRATEPFHYKDKGSMATIGRASAVAELGGRHLHGLVAWLAWLLVHLLFLVDFRSRLVVLIHWAWAYIGYKPVARVIAEPADEPGGERHEKPRAPGRPPVTHEH